MRSPVYAKGIPTWCCSTCTCPTVAGWRFSPAWPPRCPIRGSWRFRCRTLREREVLRLLARGYAYKEIAAELYISIKTVETHASNVLRKLQLSNRHQLTRWAADRRML